MKKLVYLIILFCSLQGFGQNLIPNPGFEGSSLEWLGRSWVIMSKPGTVPDNVLGQQHVNEGSSYVCLANYYGTTNDNLSVQLESPLKVGTHYTLEFQASLVDGNGGGFNPSKCKIRVNFFDDYNYASKKPEGNKSESYDYKITDQDSWIPIKIGIVADRPYTHLSIKLYMNVFENSGTYIDDFSLTECGYDNCSQTKGAISPAIINSQTSFGLKNIDNISSIRNIQIFSNNGSLVATEEDYYSVNGFTENFYLSDHNLSEARYTVKFTLGNDCYDKDYSLAWYFTNKDNFYTVPRKTYTTTEIPVAGCKTNVVLKGGTLYGVNQVDVKYTMTNTGDLIIPSGANCTFKAGSRIYISGTFKAEKGAVFKAQPR